MCLEIVKREMTSLLTNSISTMTCPHSSGIQHLLYRVKLIIGRIGTIIIKSVPAIGQINTTVEVGTKVDLALIAIL